MAETRGRFGQVPHKQNCSSYLDGVPCDCGATETYGIDAYLGHADAAQAAGEPSRGAPDAEREFCEGCDHGVVAGHVCELCGGAGYKERRKFGHQERTALLEALKRERDLVIRAKELLEFSWGAPSLTKEGAEKWFHNKQQWEREAEAVIRKAEGANEIRR